MEWTEQRIEVLRKLWGQGQTASQIAAILGCIGLYAFLPPLAQLVLIVWGAIGLLIYFGYSRSRSHVGRGLIEVHELDADAPHPPGV